MSDNDIKKRLRDTKVLVVGDLMLDRYWFGSANRISPEAPVPVVAVSREESRIGGAGNVAANISLLGADASLMSIVGRDSAADELLHVLKEKNIKESLIYDSLVSTTIKTRVVAQQQQLIRLDFEGQPSGETSLALMKLFTTEVNKYDAVIFSDYGKGVLRDIEALIDVSRDAGKLVFVDPKGNNFSKYKHSSFLTPNKKEASEATGINISDQKSIKDALIHLKDFCKLNISLITLSEDGISLFDDQFRTHPTVAREVFDVTGAGDTVIAALGYALAVKQDIDSAVILANLAAGVVVGKIGSATTSFKEIINYESLLNTSDCEASVLSLVAFIEILDNLRKSKKKVVFTNGCFDILHMGHVKYLEKAKKLGDILVVGINSDNSVARLKGKNRPINSLRDRSCVLASLKSVDYVIPFSEDTPIELITAIVPDILVKGGDYKNKEVVGKDIAKELVLIDFIEGKSTSNTIRRIQTK